MQGFSNRISMAVWAIGEPVQLIPRGLFENLTCIDYYNDKFQFSTLRRELKPKLKADALLHLLKNNLIYLS